jgi:Predicted transcriptional regulators
LSFANNLKKIRSDKKISQEGLADLLDVSRQAVSKWEHGIGFPTMDKMIILSQELNVSLDALVFDINYQSEPQNQPKNITGKIMIQDFSGEKLISCYKFFISAVFKSKKDEPSHALFGVYATSFWGDSSTILGWYSSKENAKAEIDDIMNDIRNGIGIYELKYNSKVKSTGFFGNVKLKQ